jgi:hypothetical protein
MIWILFESVAALGAVLGVVLFALLVYWRRSGRAMPLLIGLAAAVLLFTTQALVVTARERIAVLLTDIEKDIVRSRTSALAAALAPDFETAGMDRDTFLAYVRRQMDKVAVRSVERQSLRVEHSDDRLVVTADYLADVTVQGYARELPTRWSLTFVRTADGWRIVNIRPLYVAGIGNPTWGEIDAR